jgi:GxxExxY protein
MRPIDEITGRVIHSGLCIHRELGPGLMESVYETVLSYELQGMGLAVERQNAVSFQYRGATFEDAFKVDLLVEGRLVIELKSVEKLSPVHAKQVLTYLRLLDLPVGLLMNFGGATFREGLKRIVNRYPSSSGRLPLLPKS